MTELHEHSPKLPSVLPDNRAALLWHERRRDRLNESYLKRLFHLREALDNQDAAGVIYLRDIAKQHHCHSTLVTRANPAGNICVLPHVQLKRSLVDLHTYVDDSMEQYRRRRSHLEKLKLIREFQRSSKTPQLMPLRGTKLLNDAESSAQISGSARFDKEGADNNAVDSKELKTRNRKSETKPQPAEQQVMYHVNWMRGDGRLTHLSTRYLKRRSQMVKLSGSSIQPMVTGVGASSVHIKNNSTQGRSVLRNLAAKMILKDDSLSQLNNPLICSKYDDSNNQHLKTKRFKTTAADVPDSVVPAKEGNSEKKRKIIVKLPLPSIT